MNKFLRLALLLCIAFASKLNAQCDLNPTITPPNPILCPNGTDTLSTQKFDSYQWYKNGHAIPGATDRTYVVTQDDVVSYFKVEVTKDGCTDTSRRVLVDGYVFLLPFIIETGDVGIYDPSRDALIQCPGDTLILTLGDPYNVNIQWYDQGQAIKGANEQTYYVTSSGSYTVCGAPEVCPDYNSCESIPINVIFETPTAKIKERNDTLFATKAKRYQWFFNGKEIAGATDQYYVPNAIGRYKVAIADKYRCIAVSDAYFYTPSLKALISVAPNPVSDILHAHINVKGAAKIIISDLYGTRVLQSLITSPGDQNISMQNIRPGTYVLQVWDKQGRMQASTTIIKQ